MNRTRSNDEILAMAESLGPTEKLVNLIINFPDHLWHNRPGVIRNGRWKAANRREIAEHREHGRLSDGAEFRPAGPNDRAIVRVYTTLAEIWKAKQTRSIIPKRYYGKCTELAKTIITKIRSPIK